MRKSSPKGEAFFRALTAVFLLVGGGVFFWVILGLDASGGGVAGALALERYEEVGTDHPVTAVLLGFRAYDTLLELVVLLTAFWGVWSLGEREEEPLSPPPDVLLERVALGWVPVLILLSIYLLYAGGHQPGGEFQAGAVLGAAGVLLLLVGRPIPGSWRERFVESLAVLGPAIFVVIGILGILMTGDVLALREGWEKALLLTIEAGAVLSIGMILTALFAGSEERLRGGVREER